MQFCVSVLYTHSRSAVIRGRVVSDSGRGVVGVRVTRADSANGEEGYTVTR